MSSASAWFAVIVVSALLIAVPLGWWPKDPYGLIKWTMVGVGAVAISGVWLALSIGAGRLSIRRNAITVPLLLFIAWSCLSLLIGPHEYFAWKRLNEVLFMGLIYIVLTCSVGERWRRGVLVVASMIGLTAITVLGVGQYMGIYSTDSPWGSSLGRRIYATMLNPNYLAAYIISLFPMALSFFVIGGRRWWTLVLLAVVLLSASLCLLFTVSWGGWLGWLVAVVLLVTLAFTVARPYLRAGRLIAILLVFAVLASVFLYMNRETVASDYSGMKFRILYWRASVAMIKERPFVGSGLNAFTPNIPRYLTEIVASDYGTGLPEDGSAVTVYGGIYAHNEYLGVWLELGLVGILLFIWLMWRFFVQAWRNLAGDSGAMEAAINAGALCAVAAMLVQSIFSYPLRLPATTVSCAVLMALVGSGSRTRTATVSIALPLLLRILIGVAVIGCAVFLVPVLIAPLVGEGLYVEARRASYIGDWETVAAKCSAALEYPLTEPEIFDLAGDAHKKLGSPREAIGALHAKLELKPYDVHAYLKLGKLYDRLGMEERAVWNFRRAMELERDDSAEGRVHLAAILDGRGSGDEALALLEAGLARYQQDWMLSNALGVAYAGRGDWNRAGREFVASREAGGDAVPKYNLRVLAAYMKPRRKKTSEEGGFIGPREYGRIKEHIENGRSALKRGRYRKAHEEFRAVLDAYPDYVPALSGMGMYLAKTQRLQEALELWKRATALDPEHRIDRL